MRKPSSLAVSAGRLLRPMTMMHKSDGGLSPHGCSLGEVKPKKARV
jgi:hypothetical protein